MAELPNSVKSRLSQSAGGSVPPHPDADQLNAFAEQALPAAEREQVLAHLAQCADCREIVALAAPAPEAGQQPALAPRGLFGLRPDFFRWGIVAASAAVVVAAVLLVRPELTQRQTGETRLARLEADRAPAPAAVQEPKEAPVEQLSRKADGSAKRDLHSAAAPPRPAAKLDSANGPPPVIASKNGDVYAFSAARTEPSHDRVANLSAEAGVSGGVQPSAPPALAQSAPPASVVAGRADGAEAKAALNPAPAKNSAPKEEVGKSVSVGGGSFRTRPASEGQFGDKTKPATENQLANEKDEKKQAAEVQTYAAAEMRLQESARGVQPLVLVPASALSRTWRIRGGHLEWSADAGKEWTLASAPGGNQFFSVESHGANVWAGAASGIIVRSVDAGFTWITLQPSGWTGSVVYLRFQDERRGEMKTSTGEAWETLDGGITWKRK